MFCQSIPGSEQTMEEYMNAPVEVVADDCWKFLGDLTKDRALDMYEADPQLFKSALEQTLQRHSDERKALRLRDGMGMMNVQQLHDMCRDSHLNPRTRKDIDEELHDRIIRDRIVQAAILAIETNKPNCWSDDLPESDQQHILWEVCDQHILTRARPSYVPRFVGFSQYPSSSALRACMKRLQEAQRIA